MHSEGSQSSRTPSIDSEPTETTSLLHSSQNTLSAAAPDEESAVHNKWNNDIETAAQDTTTWQKETVILAKTALPLMFAFGAEYTLAATSIFTVGHLGNVELGGAALGMMSSNITGFMVFASMATSLDTLCAQAYGSGKKELVGIYVQRMLLIFAVIYVPMVILWWFSEPILTAIVPDHQVAQLASLYLRYMIIAAPGLASFECLKRFMQAQGIFSAGTYTMLVVAPVNIFLHWLFVYKFGWGFVGAPRAVAISQCLLPFGMLAYIFFVNGRECWGGFSKKAFSNWRPMFHLAIPGLIMGEAEACAFELLTFGSSRIGTTTLAAQSILQTIIGCIFQIIPGPTSVAGSTRIGNLLGGARIDAAKTATKVLIITCALQGIVNMILISTLRFNIPFLFNTDPVVVDLAGRVLPLCAAFQLFDTVQAATNGVLRGIGRQKVGGYLLLFCFYCVGVPISFGLAFGANLKLLGLWTGTAIALALVSLVELIYIRQVNWQKVLDSVVRRVAME